MRLLRIAGFVASISSTPATAQGAGALPPGFTTDPEQARLEIEDVRRLALALRMAAGASTEDSLRIIEQEYLAQASPGLRAWTERYDVTPRTMVAAIRERPGPYGDLEALADAVMEHEQSLRSAFRELRELFPGAVFPPVWFLVGDHAAGGLARPEGVLIAIERLSDDLRDVVPLVLHELAHIQSAMLQGPDVYRRIFGPDRTLLALALREGSADLIARLATGRHTNDRAERYGLQHEQELWTRFSREMHRRDPGDWMFVRPENADWPPDLGYWMGYRIASSYYEHADDKQQAVRDILNLTDFPAFLAASRYAERLEK